MKRKHYAKHQDWLKFCYSKKSLLPPPLVNRSRYQQPPENTVIAKKNESRYWDSIGNISKFLSENIGKLITFGLAAQVAAVQAVSAGSARSHFISNDTMLYLMNNTDFKSDSDILIKETYSLTDKLNNDQIETQEMFPKAFVHGITRKKRSPENIIYRIKDFIKNRPNILSKDLNRIIGNVINKSHICDFLVLNRILDLIEFNLPNRITDHVEFFVLILEFATGNITCLNQHMAMKLLDIVSNIKNSDYYSTINENVKQKLETLNRELSLKIHSLT